MPSFQNVRTADRDQTFAVRSSLMYDCIPPLAASESHCGLKLSLKVKQRLFD